jgi:hypothetical protein
MDASKSRNAVKIRVGSSNRDNSIIMDVISSRIKALSNSNRDHRNITYVNSRRETSNSNDAINSRD